MLPPLNLYNTLTHSKEAFIPRNPDQIGMYSCGPTVYSTPSIGNYRAFFTADLIRNTLANLYDYPVKSIMNITDVGHLTSDGDTGEDKLEKGAKKDGITAREVASKYEKQFLDGLAQLNIDKFDVMPRATDHISQQQVIVQALIDKGYTYIIDGDGIYMDTSRVEDYGELMGPNYKKRLENLNAGERVNFTGKKNATDFALWKFSPDDKVGEKRQMERDFPPYGMGFPGRHIECSAMSSEYLGQHFDIHHGGADHITIHHPNEIAQSESAFDIHHPDRRVRYRLHNEFLQVNGGKMSKSLGNVYTLSDLEDKGFSPLDLRFFFFMAHYRTQQNFTREALKQAQTTRNNIQKKLSNYSYPLDQHIDRSSPLFIALTNSLADDLNTPKMLSTLNSSLSNLDQSTLSTIYRFEKNILKVGLFDSISLLGQNDIPQSIIDLANQRLAAKKDKNFALADQIRTQIGEQGFTITDTPDGFEITLD
ncbi:cysteine--tRNA ligase [candidate division SR1 bacterium]|nr:cysteine--tRNA ligase [candidate division SR1 bacterium]